MSGADNRPARLLVASDQRSEATSVQRLLLGDYPQVATSFDPDRVVEDFRQAAPDVLVLAFDRIEKAQQYYLGLYRFGMDIHEHAHRTVLLCHKDEVKKAFDLCRKQYFDDYVMFWPLPYDGCRLPMSVHVALGELRRTRDRAASEHRLHQHARQLATFGQQLDASLRKGRNDMGTASRGWTQTRDRIDHAIGGLAEALLDERLDSGVRIENADALRARLKQFSRETLRPLMDSGQCTVEQLQAWAQQLQGEWRENMAHVGSIVDIIESETRRILVVDDDDFTRKLVGQMLEREGLEIVCAASGAEALQLLSRMRPTLILMDIKLPGLDGVEVTRRLKSTPQFADIPVIMLTGYSHREAVMDSLAVGACDFLAKPVSPAALLSKIQRYLGAPDTPRQETSDSPEALPSGDMA